MDDYLTKSHQIFFTNPWNNRMYAATLFIPRCDIESICPVAIFHPPTLVIDGKNDIEQMDSFPLLPADAMLKKKKEHEKAQVFNHAQISGGIIRGVDHSIPTNVGFGRDSTIIPRYTSAFMENCQRYKLKPKFMYQSSDKGWICTCKLTNQLDKRNRNVQFRKSSPETSKKKAKENVCRAIMKEFTKDVAKIE